MTMTFKRIAGGVLAAALLTAGARVMVSGPRWLSNLKPAFSEAAQAPRTVNRAGWDYKGPDDPASFQKDVALLARKDRPLIVMLAMPGCPACGDLMANLH